MYTLRKITESGTEFNQFLGKNYNLVLSEKSPQQFKEIHKDFFKADFKENNPVENVLCYGFIHSQNCQETYALFKNEKNYVMTESGKTFANICF